ncbi:hypothetical protein, partial [Endothiovibrio diazotrophicus]
LYTYVLSDPVNFIDRDGMASEKIGGERVTVHANDVDPWPSDPHGHVYDKNQVIDANGNIYDKNTKKKIGKLSKKNLGRWTDFLKKIGKLGLLGDLFFVKQLVDSVCAADPLCSMNKDEYDEEIYPGCHLRM